MVRPLRYENGTLYVLDQRRLPGEVRTIECGTHADVASAIKGMAVRGAPAIGIAAAYGMAIAAREALQGTGPVGAAREEEVLRFVKAAGDVLASTRPTAVNLFWAIERMLRVAAAAGRAPSAQTGGIAQGGPEAIVLAMEDEARAIEEEDVRNNVRIGELGSGLVPGGASILTHCNAGALATGGHGTALGVIRTAWRQGKNIKVYADETRPLLQGARLTAWELVSDGIPVTILADNMAGYLMSLGRVDLVIVGADRIAANGDVANKIGTYSLAVLAREHGVPFYVAAPWSTVDLGAPGAEAIPIEERESSEVTHVAGVRVAPEGVAVFNPAFDVTPARLITAIITEKGIVRPPLGEGLRAAGEGDARHA
ncbi:MAG: S-methyl-5-thioribose-1-phosphate isomerase [Bacillota bacterium]